MMCPTCGRPEPQRRSAPLTKRQAEILAMLAENWSIDDVSDQLYLARETVRWHVKRAYWRLGVHTREDAISRARDLDLI